MRSRALIEEAGAGLNWDSLSAHGADQPFEPQLYSTRVGFVAGVIALIAAQFCLAPFVFAANWMASAEQPDLDFPIGAAFFLAVSFPFVARSAHNFLSQRGETRTVAYALLGTAFYLPMGMIGAGADSLSWIAPGISGTAAMAGFRLYNLEQSL